MGRRSAVGTTLLVVALITVALVLVARSFASIPLLGDDPNVIYDATSLPASLHVCGRSWSLSAGGAQSREQIVDASGIEPIVVSPRQYSACPSGACTAAAGGPCDTVIFARIGPDAFAAYALRGGP